MLELLIENCSVDIAKVPLSVLLFEIFSETRPFTAQGPICFRLFSCIAVLIASFGEKLSLRLISAVILRHGSLRRRTRRRFLIQQDCPSVIPVGAAMAAMSVTSLASLCTAS